jgi:hypothetical protein
MVGFPLKLFGTSDGLLQSLEESVKKLESIFNQLESSSVPAFT